MGLRHEHEDFSWSSNGPTRAGGQGVSGPLGGGAGRSHMLALYISRGVLQSFRAETLCRKAPLKSPLLSFLKPRSTSTTAGVSTAAVIAGRSA